MPTIPTRMRVGIGYRRELAAQLFAAPGAVDFVEVVAEAWRDPDSRRELRALAEVWPIVPHGVKLSLGSAEGIDDARAAELARLAREVKAPLVSEHVSFVRAGGREIGHLTELPMTRAAVTVVARNVDRLRRLLPDVPLLLENVARAFVWRPEDSEMSEADFYAEIVRATGCDLLLDVGNLYANARNAGHDPFEVLASFPLERVAMLHVAGGIEEHGFYFDTHAHPVPEAVFELVARSGCPSVLLERDAAFDDAVFDEVARLRSIVDAMPGRPSPPREHAHGMLIDDAAPLAAAQARLAEALTSSTPTDDVAIARARGVLERKRADDALPLLPELGPRLSQHDALALGRIRETPRLPSMTAVADAMRIARAARERSELAPAAERDLARLEARFGGGPERPRPRAWPVRRLLEQWARATGATR